MGKRLTKVTTSHWGAFAVSVENGRIVSTKPIDIDPEPSDIALNVPAAVHHKSRIDQPYIRKGWLEGNRESRRGEDEYVPVPWSKAIDLAANEIQRVQKANGNGAIFGGSYGWASAGRFHHAQSQVHRFLNCIGGYVSSFASYSTGAAQAIIPHVLGMTFHKITWGETNSWPLIERHTDNLVIFGGINPKNAQVSMGGTTEHVTEGWFKRFAKGDKYMVSVSPQRDDSPPETRWLPIEPGTDTALMLALAYVLETEGSCDRAFLESHCTGYEVFLPYLLGHNGETPKTPDWAASICGISADNITSLARRMASGRTLICVSWSLQRAQHGEQPYWMACVLAAMLGQIGLPGGGIGFGYGAIGNVGKTAHRLQGPVFEQGNNPISDFIPVSRIADMLLNPNGAYDFNGQCRKYPDIRLVYWCGGNPFHHHQDLNRLNEAWQRPETIIVHEPWWTATARRADIVLPATTQFEREDIGWAKGDPYLFHMPQMIKPVGDAKDDYDIFYLLAKRMGCCEAFSCKRSSEQWIAKIYQEFATNARIDDVVVPNWEELKAQNFVRLKIDTEEFDNVPFEAFRKNPKYNPLGTPSGKIEIYSRAIAGFKYDDVPGHPVFHPPSKDNEYPLRLTSPQPGNKLHSQLQSAIEDHQYFNTVRMHPKDAISRKLQDQDQVLVCNANGSCLAQVLIASEIKQGVVSMVTGSWYAPAPDGVDISGNPNVLTKDCGTSRLGQGAAAHNVGVEVKKFHESLSPSSR